MERISILHISDLHFFADDPSNLNNKDQDKPKPFSDTMKSQLIYKDSKDCFYKNALNIFGKQKFDLIACTGDLGHQNISGSIKKGADYISKLADRLEVPRDHVIISPGNHDLDRDAMPGNEFIEFIDACSSEEFTFPYLMSPAYFEIKGIPVISINTCLGGTEHALHGLPEEFWDIVKKFITENDDLANILNAEMPAEFKHQIQAMSIPAIGQSQLESIWSYLTKNNGNGNFSVLLCHHNPLPAHKVEIRPYSNIIDAGPLLYGLMQHKRRVFILHGHTHCETSLTIHTDEQNEHGFITAIGSNGLYSSISSSVANIQILIDSNKNFLVGLIDSRIKRGDDFSAIKSYEVYDIPTEEIQSTYNLDDLDPNTTFEFKDIASKLNTIPDDNLAEDLLKFSRRRQLNISNLRDQFDNWIINRIG